VLTRLLIHFDTRSRAPLRWRRRKTRFDLSLFDAIISDIGLPDGTGYDLISEAKRSKNIKAVALTGYGMSHDLRRSEEAGFDFT